MKQLLVGLTGGLASGKSTVARLLGEAGCTIIDADAVVADLYRPGAPGSEAVKDLFGEEVLDKDGSVDRPKVAAKVFGDDDARRRLEKAVHPLVRQKTQELIAAAEGIVVYEATLLVEAGRADDFDIVVSVETGPKNQLRRAIDRGMPEEEAAARLRAQGDGGPRRARADRILRNDDNLEALEDAVAKLYEDLGRRLNQGAAVS